MKSLIQSRRAVAFLMLGVFATSLVAPVAEAGHGRGNGRRWKRAPVVREVRYVAPSCSTPRVRYVSHHSDAGPILAGIFGGIVLGAAIANAQPAVHANYSYWDPYCETSYGSLSSYRSHIRGCGHPQVVRVIEVRSGEHVRDLCWQNNSWREYDGDWRDRDDDWRDRGDDWRGDDDDTRYKDDRDWDDN